MLYVVFDDTGRCLVSREDPAPTGPAERADYDGVVAIVPTGPDWFRSAPDLTTARLLTAAYLTVVGGATVTAAAIINPLLAFPVGAAAALYVGRHHNATAARMERSWSESHRMLATRPEVTRFRRAFDAARTVLVAWPFLAELVQTPSPSREVAASLWSLAGLLRDHADLSEQHAALTDAGRGRSLPPDTTVRAALDDRLSRVEAARDQLSTQIDHRVESLTMLAARCADYVRTEAALHTAYEAVRRADESLSRVVSTSDGPDETRSLSERTAAILEAYRELTTRG